MGVRHAGNKDVEAQALGGQPQVNASGRVANASLLATERTGASTIPDVGAVSVCSGPGGVRQGWTCARM
jgi:hypothetical protein